MLRKEEEQLLKNKIYSYLKKATKKLDLDNISEEFTADYIASLLGVKRNTISHYLNQKVAEGSVIKINSRPVYFFDKEVFQFLYYAVDKTTFGSIEELEGQEIVKKPDAEEEEDFFSKIIGAKSSLKKSIEQIKISINYPDNSLPILLQGGSGVGKSFMAEKIYQYAVEQQILKKDAPFIVYNCAQYADNPELLASNIFGYVKGAYTGAVGDSCGLLGAANRGILFLDEVHRLNKESQEKLFIFLDKGIYRRVGETERELEADVRIIMATTENPDEYFLGTFLRRIPIRIKIPELQERSEEEKMSFIYMMFINESRLLKRKIKVTGSVLEILKNYRYSGNVGELKSTIKWLCGKAYMKSKNQKIITVGFFDLPEEITASENKIKNKRVENQKNIIFAPDMQFTDFQKKNHRETAQIHLFADEIMDFYIGIEKYDYSWNELLKWTAEWLDNYFDDLMFRKSADINTDFLKITIENMYRIFYDLEDSYNIKFNGNTLFAIGLYLSIPKRFEKEEEEKYKSLLAYIMKNCEISYQLANDITEMLADEMSVVIRIPDIIIVTLYIESQMSFKSNRTRALIAAHGYATASSMANVANRILNGRIYDSFDMPIECNAQEMQHNIEQYIRTYCTEKGMVLLVDMGSLEHVYEPALSAIKGPVLLVNNISTQMAIHIGTLIDEGCPVVEMIDQIKDANIPEVKLFYPREKKGKAILSFCFTGDATAKQIKEMLQKCIPEELNIHILDCDFESLKKNGKDFSAFRFYDVLGIIGTTDIEIKDVEYISLESLIMGTAEEQLLEMFDGIADRDIIKEINDNVVRNCSIERLLDTLTILDTNKIVLNIDKCLHRYEKFSGEELNNSKKAWSFLHVSCMVERLIRRQPINTYANLEKFSGDAEKELNIIKQSFAMLEKEYQIEIPLSELGYIYDILMS